jgi:hypothetical protein
VPGTGHAGPQARRRATAVKVLTQSPHETGTSPSLQSLQDSDENSEARGRSPALSESVVLNGTSRTAWPGTEAQRLPQCHRDCGTAFQTSTSVTASGTVRVRLRLPVGLGRSPGVTAVTVRLDMVRDSESEAVNWAARWDRLLGSVQPGLPGRPSLPGWTKPVWRPPGESGLRWRPAVWPGRSTLPQKWVLTVIRIGSDAVGCTEQTFSNF